MRLHPSSLYIRPLNLLSPVCVPPLPPPVKSHSSGSDLYLDYSYEDPFPRCGHVCTFRGLRWMCLSRGPTQPTAEAVSGCSDPSTGHHVELNTGRAAQRKVWELNGTEVLGSWAPEAPCHAPLSTLYLLLCSGSTADKPVLEAVPAATREKIRSRFHGSHDLIHRLFVCISGATLRPGVGVGLQTCRGRALGEHLVPGVDDHPWCRVLVVPADVGVLVVPGPVRGLPHCVMSPSPTLR